MSYEHYYPVTCPTCRAPLTEPGCLDLCFAIADQIVWSTSHLSEEGRLQDVDRLVEGGHHSDTCCRSCGESLAEFELNGPARASLSEGTADTVARLVEAAKEHGANTGEMGAAIGDLHTVLDWCWQQLSNPKRGMVLAKCRELAPEFTNFVEPP